MLNILVKILIGMFIFVNSCYSQQNTEVKRVIFIGIDGLGSYSANGENWHSTGLPKNSQIENHMNKLWERMNRKEDDVLAAWTFRLLNRQNTSSGINWSSLFTGTNESLTGIGTLTNTGNGSAKAGKRRVPHIFQVFKRQHPDKRVFGSASWPGIEGLLNGKNWNNGLNTKESDSFDIFIKQDQCNTEKGGYSEDADKNVLSDILGELDNDEPANLMFGYFLHVDNNGHAHGWAAEQYKNAMEHVDDYLEEIFNKLKDKKLHEETIVILTADHGGGGFYGDLKSHGKNTLNERLTPLIVFGPSNLIDQGEMKSPGDDLDSYTKEENFLSIDVAMTIAAVFGIKVPDEWQGNVLQSIFQQKLDIPEKVLPNFGAAFHWTNDKNYMFNDKVYVRYNYDTDKIANNYPRLIKNFWGEKGKDDRMWFSDIDAALNRSDKENIAYFFKGTEYVKYDLKTDKVWKNFPKTINASGLWPGLNWEKIDAAVDIGDGNAFLFRDKEVKLFDFKKNKAGKPQDICDVFEDFDCEKSIDASLRKKNSDVFLFSGSDCWKYEKKKEGYDNIIYKKIYGPVKITNYEGGLWEGLMMRDY